MITLKAIRAEQSKNGNRVIKTGDTFNGANIYIVQKKLTGIEITRGTLGDLWVFCGFGW